MKKIRGIIWDMDGTLYKYHPEDRDSFINAIGRAAIELGAPLELEEAAIIALDSYKQFNNPSTIFIEK